MPVLLVVTHRAEPGGEPDEPQHEQMGRITPALLDTMEIPWARFPAAVDAKADVQIVRKLGASADHPVALTFPEGEYLKGLLLRRA